MRQFERVYTAAGYAAAFFLTMIAVVILAQIGGRLFGFVVTDGDEIAAWCMASSSFLALAHTFRRGDHIRVSLIIDRLRPDGRRGAELWCLALGCVVTAVFAAYAVDFVRGSFLYDERSVGRLALPLWIPQSGMAAGAVLIALAMVDELVRVLRGGAVQATLDAARTE